MSRLREGDLVVCNPAFGGEYVGVVVRYEPPAPGFSWSGDKGHYLMLDRTGRTSLYPLEYIHAITKFGENKK